MEHAKKKLTPVQRLGINEKMFELAYIIVTTNRNEEDIRKETNNCINPYEILQTRKISHVISPPYGEFFVKTCNNII